jgi:predicted lipoprotein with Yx(FWY)xxD motif
MEKNNPKIKSVLRTISIVVSMTLLAVGFLGLSSCSEDDPAINIGEVKLQSDATLGEFLVDGNGMTLYIFSDDVTGQSECFGGCLAAWPLYYAPDLKPAAGLSASDFGTITRTDGAQQTTYKGWPLYYYVDDEKAGDVKGEALGNIWYVAKPQGYSIMIANNQLVGKDGKSYKNDYTEGTGLTQYFVDADGRTIYTFAKDYKDTNKFTNGDAGHDAIWPVFYTDIDALPSTLDESDFGVIEVLGNDQLTYKGHPLYYFNEDANPGETKGVSVGMVAGVPNWPIVNATVAEAVEEPTVKLSASGIMTDKMGRTLYFFARDVMGTSACSGGCLTRWPFFNPEEIILAAGSTLTAADFAFVGTGSTRQATYKGRPLYYYAPNNDGVIEAAGATGGDGFGTVWFVARTDYSLMIAHDGTTRYITDAAGRTLYLHSPDTHSVNTFSTGEPTHDANWPVFHVAIDETSKLPSGMLAEDFGSITVFGSSQLTYRGWPMYYFIQDVAKGDKKGVNATWPLATSGTTVAPE